MTTEEHPSLQSKFDRIWEEVTYDSAAYANFSSVEDQERAKVLAFKVFFIAGKEALDL